MEEVQGSSPCSSTNPPMQMALMMGAIFVTVHTSTYARIRLCTDIRYLSETGRDCVNKCSQSIEVRFNRKQVEALFWIRTSRTELLPASQTLVIYKRLLSSVQVHPQYSFGIIVTYHMLVMFVMQLFLIPQVVPSMPELSLLVNTPSQSKTNARLAMPPLINYVSQIRLYRCAAQ